ncbi:hypothetical protein KZZ08_14725 [Roseovarius mucosus]|uniref:hypothetical protein n=1 Tax=Roseovarius mucosus TaxID=215743 RepID=UPI001C5F717D|nr:hypothetical protein [Roseovarius mucosus]MBW4974886.1 hypothetical protein [Roseovarius mucosus]
MKDEQPQNTEEGKTGGILTTEKKLVPKWMQRLRKIVWPLHARYPHVIPNPYGEDKAYYRKRDAESNAKSALDKDVTLRLGCIMVSEIFGPNEIETLYDGLEKIGWDRERTPVRDGSNIDWLKTQRLYGSEGTMPLGWVHRPDDAKKYVGVQYIAEFPKQFSSLLVTISQLTPSTTCMSIGFVLTDEAALEYANALNEPAKSTRVPMRRSGTYSIMGVEHVKEERVRRIREKYRNVGISWLSKNFPGFFSEHCENSHFPTVEFLSLDGFTPFDEDAPRDRGWGHWSRFVNIDRDFGSWTCSSVPSLRFSFDAVRRENTPNHMTVALRCDVLSEEVLKIYGGDSLSSRTYFANEHLDGIIARYALASYLRELLRSLKETRQSLSARSVARRSTSEVEKISAFFRRSIGVPSIAREVLALSENDASFRWSATGFTQKSYRDEEKPYEIKEGLKSFLGGLSRQLLEEDQDTREFLNQLSSAMGTKESIAAQRRMERLTYLTLAVALVSMVIAIVTASST